MKEFSSQTGGRFTYVDDVINLQELALAFSHIFDDCDNFIVSGCEVSGNTISPGIIYLNGKLRVFNGATGISKFPQYIYEVNTTENTPYQSGGEKVGRNIWGCSIGLTVPTTLTQLTNKIPQSIKISATGGLQMKDAWFGKYAVLLNPAASSQTVKGQLSVDTLSGSTVSANSQVKVSTVNGEARLFYEGSKMVLESSVSNGATKYRLIADPDVDGFQLVRNTTVLAQFASNQITFNKPIVASTGTIGSIRLSGNQIFNTSTSTDTGEININMIGLNGDTTKYRNTHIGNGRGSKVLSVIGQTANVFVYGKLTLDAATEDAVVLISNKALSNVSLKKYILWQDTSRTNIAQFGYINSDNLIFSFINSVGSIKIQGIDSVDIAPAIKENGTLLSEKYLQKSVYTKEMDDKINKTEVYTQTQANQRFAKLDGGFSQFINATKTKAVLCSEIGALTSSDLSGYAAINKCLSDMATTEALKKQIRDNIGAAGTGDYQAKLSDTGWVNISGGLYARQIGNMVSIQGTISTIHSGTVFTLPNNITAPRYAVGYDAPMADGCYWSCKIDGGKKACTVTRCNHHGTTVPICITYMT